MDQDAGFADAIDVVAFDFDVVNGFGMRPFGYALNSGRARQDFQTLADAEVARGHERFSVVGPELMGGRDAQGFGFAFHFQIDHLPVRVTEEAGHSVRWSASRAPRRIWYAGSASLIWNSSTRFPSESHRLPDSRTPYS